MVWPMTTAAPSALTLAFITDLHFGPKAYFDGKLRKLTHEAANFTERFVAKMNAEVKPDMIVNLGDDIEDESYALDKERYAQCQNILKKLNGKLVNVAGNHDTINLSVDDLREIWGHQGHLHYQFSHAGWCFIVMHTVERQNVDVSIHPDQLIWLEQQLQQATEPVIVLMHHSASEQDLSDSFWFHSHRHLALVKNRAEFRKILEESRKVKVVFNGHVHRNHLDLINGIPYVTFQSLIENLDEDAPGRAAETHAIVKLSAERMIVRVEGNDKAKYQIEFLFTLSSRRFTPVNYCHIRRERIERSKAPPGPRLLLGVGATFRPPTG